MPRNAVIDKISLTIYDFYQYYLSKLTFINLDRPLRYV